MIRLDAGSIMMGLEEGDVELTWLGMSLSGVELLKGSPRVSLDKHHRVSTFISDGNLYSGRLGQDAETHDHSCHEGLA